MWEYELEKQNLLMALKLGMINWFQFFEGLRKLKYISSDDAPVKPVSAKPRSNCVTILRVPRQSQ